MASRRMCPSVVSIFNYAGEVDGKATYIKTVLKNVRIEERFGASSGKNGMQSADTATLYIFDELAALPGGTSAQSAYIQPDEWQAHKGWTLRDGLDRFCEGDGDAANQKRYAITGAAHFNAGSRSMWHWEVNGS